MPVIGSSSVTPDFNAVGPSGPSGATVAGPIGNTGATGSTGPTGSTGIHVVSTSKEFPYLNLNLSDGSVVQIKGVGGITGATGTVRGVNLGDGVTIFSTVGNGVTGATMWFRGITSDGLISVYLSQDSNTIAISGGAIKQGGTAGTLATDRFLYLSDGGTASASGLTFESGGIMSFDNTATLDPEENIISIASIISDDVVGITGAEVYVGGETAGDGKGIQLEVRHASVYKVSTPMGIAGFTGEFNSDEVFSFTLVIESNDLWDWPTNVYFDENDAYFSCAEDIINFISDDGGSTWNASFTVRGYGVSHGDCDGIINVGSCCYFDDQGDNQCIEYTTNDICKEKNMAVWSMVSGCSENCGATAEGICCSDGGNWGSYIGTGVCIEGKGLAECNYFGGSFWEYLYYEDAWTEGPPPAPYLKERETPEPINCYSMEDLCASPCEEEWVACCVDGVCVGDSVGSTELNAVSSNICKYVLGGVPVEGGICGTVDCCDHSVVVGACCHEGTEECHDVTNQVCSELGGIFMGPLTDCDTNICCYSVDTGICCLNASQCNCCYSTTVPQNNCCQDITFSECDYLGGSWHNGTAGQCVYGVGSCQCGRHDICGTLGVGACCIGENCSVTDEGSCNASGGTFLGEGQQCQINSCGGGEVGCCCTCSGSNESVLTDSTEEDCDSGNFYNTICDNVPDGWGCCAGCTDDSHCNLNGLQFCCNLVTEHCEVCPGGPCVSDGDCTDPGTCCCDGQCGELKGSSVIAGQCDQCNPGGSCYGACCVAPNTPWAHCSHTTEEACMVSGGGFHGCDSVCDFATRLACWQPAEYCCCCYAGGDMCLPYWPQFEGVCSDTCYLPAYPSQGQLDYCSLPTTSGAALRCCRDADTPGDIPNCNGCQNCDTSIGSECFGVGGCITCECDDICGYECVNGDCFPVKCCGTGGVGGCIGGYPCSTVPCCTYNQNCCGASSGTCCEKDYESCCGSSGMASTPNECCEVEGDFCPPGDNPCDGDAIPCNCDHCGTMQGCQAFGGYWDDFTFSCWCAPCNTPSGCPGIWHGDNYAGYCEWGACEETPCGPDYTCSISTYDACTCAKWDKNDNCIVRNSNNYSANTPCGEYFYQSGELCCVAPLYDANPMCCKNETSEGAGDGEFCCPSATGTEKKCCLEDEECCRGPGVANCCGIVTITDCDGNSTDSVEDCGTDPSNAGECCINWVPKWDCGGVYDNDPGNNTSCTPDGYECCGQEFDCDGNVVFAAVAFSGICPACAYLIDGSLGCACEANGTCEDGDPNCCNGVRYSRKVCCPGEDECRLTCEWPGGSITDRCACSESTGYDSDSGSLPDVGCCGGICYDDSKHCCSEITGPLCESTEICCPAGEWGSYTYTCEENPYGDDPKSLCEGQPNRCCCWGQGSYDPFHEHCCCVFDQVDHQAVCEIIDDPSTVRCCADNQDHPTPTCPIGEVCCGDWGCCPGEFGENCLTNPDGSYSCNSPGATNREESEEIPDNRSMDPSMPGYIPYYHTPTEPIKENKTSNTRKKKITKNSSEGIGRYMVNGICQEIYCEGNCEWPRC